MTCVGILVLLLTIYNSESQFQFSSVQSLSHVRLFATPWPTAHQASLSITNSPSLFKPMSIESVLPSNHLILSSPSPPALNLSQHQGLFQEVSSSNQVAKVLEFQPQHQSFQWTPRTDLYDGLVGSPCSPRDSQESSPTPQFKSINSSVHIFLYSLIKKHHLLFLKYFWKYFPHFLHICLRLCMWMGWLCYWIYNGLLFCLLLLMKCFICHS